MYASLDLSLEHYEEDIVWKLCRGRGICEIAVGCPVEFLVFV